MRFIVDLYRIIIIAMCGLALIFAVLIALSLADKSQLLGAAFTGWMLYAIVASLIVMILALGGTATLVSLHDRHAELVEETGRIAAALDRLAAKYDS